MIDIKTHNFASDNTLSKRVELESSVRSDLLPDGSCDCHLHILGPEELYPFSEHRLYTPMNALVPAAMQFLSQQGLSRAVIIQPSVYGTDNRCTIDALNDFPIETRAIAVVDPSISIEDLTDLHQKGIRGIRLNSINWTATELWERYIAYQPLFDHMAQLNWHFEFYVGSQVYPTLFKIIENSSVDLVLDHLGGAFRENELPEERLKGLDKFGSTGKVWIKLSGFYRLRDTDADVSSYHTIINHLLSMMSDRLIWGSDWPHTPDNRTRREAAKKTLPFQDIDTRQQLLMVRNLVQDKKIRQKLFVENPQILYDF